MQSGTLEKMRFLLWSKVHTLPLFFVRLWQRHRFSHLAKRAWKLPFYREMWGAAGFTKPPQLKDLALLPTVNKGDFLSRPPADYIYQYNPDKAYRWGQTSGSTGEPFRFILPAYADGSNERERPYTLFNRWRFLTWDSGRPFDEMLQQMPSVKFAQGARWYDLPHSFSVEPEEFYANPKQVVLKIQKRGARLLIGHASRLVEFCSVLYANDLVGTITFDYCSTSGEVLTETQRSFIENTLNCSVRDRFGTEEFRANGTECREQNGFHLNNESFILEVVGDDGVPVSDGKQGRVVITHLYNHTMPFIRYETGDYGRIFDEPCSCGLSTPRFVVDGRKLFFTFGERMITYHDVNFEFARYTGSILQWQMRKKSDEHLEVALVCGPQFKEDILTPLKEHLQRFVSDRIEISFSLYTQNERIAPGKCRLFADETSKK